MIRVVLADDHAFIRIGIRNILQKTPDIKVVGEASNGQQAVMLVEELQPDILLLDMEMPNKNGIEVARKLRETGSKTSILALSAHEDKHFILGMLANGASGYLTKEEVPDIVIRAVRGIADGERGWVSRKIAARIALWINGENPNRINMNSQEKEMMHMIAAGKPNDEIGKEIGKSPEAVEKQSDTLLETVHNLMEDY